MSDPPDYTKYTVSELEDARAFVDVQRYPDRAAAIDAELQARELEASCNVPSIPAPEPPPRGDSVHLQPQPLWVVITRRLLSLPFFAVGGICLLTLAWAWLLFFTTLGTGLLLTTMYGGVAALCITIALLLWGRAFRTIVTGVFLAGTGAYAMLMSGFTGLLSTKYFRFAPTDVDPAVLEKLAWGGMVSGALLVGVGGGMFWHALRGWSRDRDRRGQLAN